MPEQNFNGFSDNECGEHRATAIRGAAGARAWCYEDEEWCYPNAPCRGCEITMLRGQLSELLEVAKAARQHLGIFSDATSHQIHLKLEAAIKKATGE